MGAATTRSSGSAAWKKFSGALDEGLRPDAQCPCGGGPHGSTFGECCGPALDGTRLPETAVELLRSRYTAYALADGEHLFRSWHPKTRPRSVEPSPWMEWVGLDIVDVVDGGPRDDHGIVEFRARWVSGEGVSRQHGEIAERSRFERRAGRWFYLDAEWHS